MVGTSTPRNIPSRRKLVQNADASLVSIDLNDEDERSSRRSIVSKNLSASGQNESVIFTRPDEAKQHLEVCSKLYADNKINARNIWQLQVIDALQSLSKKANDNILQIAAPSLEIGAKIYGMRVDEVHTATIRLAKSMTRVNTEKKDGEESGNEEDNSTNDKTRKKTKKKVLKPVDPSSIVKDRETLVAPLQKLSSILFSDYGATDLNTIESLFTNVLPMHKHGHELVLLSNELAWHNTEDNTLTDEKVPFDYATLPEDGFICCPFKSFFLNKWDEDEEKLENLNEQSFLISDNNGQVIPELDGPLPPAEFDDDTDEDVGEAQEENFYVQQMKKNLTYITEVPSQISRLQSEYGTNPLIEASNGKLIEQLWAGPSYWKMKYIKNAKARYTGIEEKILTKKKSNVKLLKKKDGPIDFLDAEISLDSPENKKFKKIYLKKGLDLPSSFLLPNVSMQVPHIFSTMNLLIGNPKIKVISENMDLNEHKFSQILRNDDEQDDVSEGNGFNADAEGPFDNGFEHEEEGIVAHAQNVEGDLVDAPEYVEKEYIPYSLIAKKIDIKKIKMELWRILANSDQIGTMLDETITPMKFSALVENYKKTLPDARQKEISNAVVLVAFLHLCNEKCLMCTNSNFKDFLIVPGKITKQI